MFPMTMQKIMLLTYKSHSIYMKNFGSLFLQNSGYIKSSIPLQFRIQHILQDLSEDHRITYKALLNQTHKPPNHGIDRKQLNGLPQTVPKAPVVSPWTGRLFPGIIRKPQAHV